MRQFSITSTVETFPFWIVLRHIGASSSHHKNQVTAFHDSLSSAKSEAARLARETGDRFYVMQAVNWIAPQEAPLKWDDGLVEEDPV